MTNKDIHNKLTNLGYSGGHEREREVLHTTPGHHGEPVTFDTGRFGSAPLVDYTHPSGHEVTFRTNRSGGIDSWRITPASGRSKSGMDLTSFHKELAKHHMTESAIDAVSADASQVEAVVTRLLATVPVQQKEHQTGWSEPGSPTSGDMPSNSNAIESDDELDATDLRHSKFGSGDWAVRPKKQLGTMGWHPRPWQVVYTKADSAEKAIQKARSHPTGVFGPWPKKK